MDCDEPHLVPNEKTQPIQWIKRLTGALVAIGSLWLWQLHRPPLSIYEVTLGDS